MYNTINKKVADFLLIEKFTESFDIKPLLYEPILKFTEIIAKDYKNLIIFKKDKIIKHDILDWSNILLNLLIIT